MATGRKPKPTALKLIEGNRGKRRLNGREPSPAPEVPDQPEGLSDAAREIWPDLVSVLGDMGVLTRADTFAVEMLCEDLAEYRMARDALAKAGSARVYRSANGMLRIHPAVGLMSEANKRIRGWFSEFGMTPASRTRVHDLRDAFHRTDSAAAKYGL